MVWNFLEIAERLKPLAVLMENVDAIQSAFNPDKGTNVLVDLEEALKGTAPKRGGYSVVRLSLRADHYGVPQRRKRIFLVGVRKDVAMTIGIPERDYWDSGQRAEESPDSVIAVNDQELGTGRSRNNQDL